jgi:hypothetical protein
MLSVHTSPLDAPGGGDAGGMNVYVVETAKRLAARGIAVEIFTRATSSDQRPNVELCAGVHVRHVAAGPFEGLAKDDLPAQLCAFSAGVLRAEVRHDPGWYDVLHSHYWLSGQVGWLARERWGVPLVHSAHTLAKVKNELLAEGDTPEPRARTTKRAPSSASTAPIRAASARSHPASTSTRSSRATPGLRGSGSGCVRTPGSCCSSDGSSPSRPRTSSSARPRCCATTRPWPTGCRSSSSGPRVARV